MFTTKVQISQYANEGFAFNFICTAQIPVYLTASASMNIAKF